MPKQNSSMSFDEIERLATKEIEVAQENNTQRSGKREKSWDRYYGRKLGNEVKGRSQFITRDLLETIESILPFLIKLFASGDSKIEIEIKGQEPWVGKALMTKIQLDLGNSTPCLFSLFYQWFKDALISDTAFVKVAWDLDQENVNIEFDELPAEQMQQLAEDPDVKITQAGEVVVSEQGVFFTDVKAQVKKTIKDTLYAENTPHWEFLVGKKSRSMNDEHGKGQHTEVTVDYLKRINRARKGKEPYFKNLDKLESGESKSQIETADSEKSSYMDEPSSIPIEVEKGPKAPVELVEWYTRLDTDGDGYLEDVVCYVGNGHLLRWELNEDEFIPFSALSPIIDCYKFHGISYSDLLIEIQNLNTMLFRRILDNFDFQNSGRWLKDPNSAIDTYALLNNIPGSVITGKLDGLKDISPEPFNPSCLSILEYVASIKENRTGITKYNQGTDANDLNKMLDINTPVPMADGTYKTMGDVSNGDIIIGGDGKPTIVIEAHPIAMADKAYDITFASGETVTACDAHLWQAQTDNDRRYNKTQIVDTSTIVERRISTPSGTKIWTIPRLLRPHFSKQNTKLPLDPYILGAWLGDGHLHRSRITTADDYVLSRFKLWADKTGHIVKEHSYQNSGKAKTYDITSSKILERDTKTQQFKNKGGLRHALCTMGVMNGSEGKDKTIRKHIPEVYFTASHHDRMELLRGLMDTDGCHHSNALVIFTQKKGSLSRDVVRLIESLGGWPSVCVTHPGDWAREDCDYVNINFTLPDNPFNTPEKAGKFVPSERSQDHQYINSAKEVAPCFMRCLTVDNKDGLYCVGKRFTVTHNTAHGIAMIQSAAMQRLELIGRIFAEIGVKDFYRKCVLLYQNYLRQPFIAKVLGQEKQITPDMIQGQVQTTVNMGVVASVGQEEADKIERILGVLFKVNELFPGLLTPESVHNLMARYITASGFNNVDDFIGDIQQYVQKMMESQKQQSEMQQKMMELEQHFRELELQFKGQDSQTKAEKVKQDGVIADAELEQEKEIATAEIFQKDKDSKRDHQLGLIELAIKGSQEQSRPTI